MAVNPDTIASGQAWSDDLERHRRELTGYCYRMLGSPFEADDAVQETIVRAWRAADSFEGRASVRSWLYRIATNVCLDMLRGRQRRARPVDLGPASPPDPAFLAAVGGEHEWVLPMPDARVIDESGDPAEVAATRETIRLAFVAALQHLPARQRAVLILCEVLRWQASEVATLLDTTVASVNSALQRARATLAARDIDISASPATVAADQRALLARFVEAFERYDIPAIVEMLRDDAVQSMPPYAMWLQGREAIATWLEGPGIGCRGSRVLVTAANGCPAYGQYRIDPAGGHAPWGLTVLETDGEKVRGYHNFLAPLDPRLFELFGLPAHLPATGD
ncbi:MAG TPA: sigma-70 family RNA polymerase sigma factor [Acidimicrobiales bacterium]|nr:sigma-70 family RNA polymerase sigma factor [Acidimicrobiales bacterium]